MSYEAVLLDLDDTLYPYAPCNEAGKRAALEAFDDLGYELDRETFDELYLHARREAKRELGGTAASHERFIYFKRALRSHADVHDAAAAFTLGRAYWDGYMDAMEPFDGVESTLRGVRDAGLHVVVVTNLTTRIQLEKLVRLGFDDQIDRLVTSEEVGREKPSALPFTTALADLDIRPSDAVMVGDNVTTDVEGGNAVGMDTVLFNADPGPDGALRPIERPDRRIDEFAELTEVAL
ncbi:HAD family hydrolase [Halorubrum sp. DTA98]|uniref:HAD family hydrolase n=1 Tax=Halorubrum sp. DTA98 TaxID=3402163 RepID=UPI003AB01EA2